MYYSVCVFKLSWISGDCKCYFGEIQQEIGSWPDVQFIDKISLRKSTVVVYCLWGAASVWKLQAGFWQDQQSPWWTIGVSLAFVILSGLGDCVMAIGLSSHNKKKSVILLSITRSCDCCCNWYGSPHVAVAGQNWLSRNCKEQMTLLVICTAAVLSIVCVIINLYFNMFVLGKTC